MIIGQAFGGKKDHLGPNHFKIRQRRCQLRKWPKRYGLERGMEKTLPPPTMPYVRNFSTDRYVSVFTKVSTKPLIPLMIVLLGKVEEAFEM